MNRRKLKVIGQIALVVAAVALVYIVLMVIDNRMGLFDSDDDDYYDEEELPITIGDQEYELTHEVTSYLIMGTDNSGKEELDRTNYEGSMADFLLVLMVDDTDETYGMIQINRDTISEVPFLLKDGTDYASADIQLCVAHAYGGSKRESCENTVKAVSIFLGNIPIDGYYALKMEAIPELNHVVGGVTVTIEDDFTSVDAQMKVGATLKLTDEQAYTFLRARQGLGDGDNISRMRRQTAYMEAFIDEVQTKAVGSKKFVSQVYDELADYATTDMGSKTMTNLAQKLSSYTSKGMVTPEGTATVGYVLGDGIEHAEFYVDESALETLIMDMYPLRKVEEDEEE